MKGILLFLLTCFGYTHVMAQSADAASTGLFGGRLAALYVVDGIAVNDKFLTLFTDKDILNKKNIADGVPKDTVFITLKDHSKLIRLLKTNRFSMQELASQNIANLTKNSPVIFFRNDTLLTNTAGLSVPELTVFKTTVLRASKTSYYGNFPDTTFFYFYTTPQPMFIR